MIDEDYWEIIEILKRTIAIKRITESRIMEEVSVRWFDKKFIEELFVKQLKEAKK